MENAVYYIEQMTPTRSPTDKSPILSKQTFHLHMFQLVFIVQFFLLQLHNPTIPVFQLLFKQD